MTTTEAKARDIKPFFEKLVTLAVKVRSSDKSDDAAAALRARRALHRLLGDRAIVPADHQATYDGMSSAARAKTLRMASGRRHRTGEPKGRLAFTAQSVAHRLINTVAPRYEDRPGGYTRLIRLPNRRLGDKSRLAMLQLVGDEEAPTSLTKPRKSCRRRRADARYSMAIKASKQWAKAGAGAAAMGELAPKTDDESSEQEASH